MYVLAYIRTYLHTYIRTYVHMHIGRYVHMYINMYLNKPIGPAARDSVKLFVIVFLVLVLIPYAGYRVTGYGVIPLA